MFHVHIQRTSPTRLEFVEILCVVAGHSTSVHAATSDGVIVSSGRTQVF